MKDAIKYIVGKQAKFDQANEGNHVRTHSILRALEAYIQLKTLHVELCHSCMHLNVGKEKLYGYEYN